jgi:hypothetical protein
VFSCFHYYTFHHLCKCYLLKRKPDRAQPKVEVFPNLETLTLPSPRGKEGESLICDVRFTVKLESAPRCFSSGVAQPMRADGG